MTVNNKDIPKYRLTELLSEHDIGEIAVGRYIRYTKKTVAVFMVILTVLMVVSLGIAYWSNFWSEVASFTVLVISLICSTLWFLGKRKATKDYVEAKKSLGAEGR